MHCVGPKQKTPDNCYSILRVNSIKETLVNQLNRLVGRRFRLNKVLSQKELSPSSRDKLKLWEFFLSRFSSTTLLQWIPARHNVLSKIHPLYRNSRIFRCLAWVYEATYWLRALKLYSLRHGIWPGSIIWVDRPVYNRPHWSRFNSVQFLLVETAGFTFDMDGLMLSAHW